jgi:SAM-dependent methyltransferase
MKAVGWATEGGGAATPLPIPGAPPGAANEPGTPAFVAVRRRPWFEKEFRLRLAGELFFQRAAVIGAGAGDDALVLADLGAEVVAALPGPERERCRARALRAGVAHNLLVLGDEPLPERQFDVVWANGVLAASGAPGDATARLVRLARPGGLLLLSEPLCPGDRLGRALRRLLAPGARERPLDAADLAAIAERLPDLEIRRYGFAVRAARLLHARAPALEELATSVASLADRVLLELPGLRAAAAQAVLWGRAPWNAGPRA